MSVDSETRRVHDHQQAFHFTDFGRNQPTRIEDPYDYQIGYGNLFQSEIIPGTLPIAQNHPQICRFNLYTEQLNASAFTAPRNSNLTTLMYRCRPSCASGKEVAVETGAKWESSFLTSNPCMKMLATQAEWSPFQIPQERTDFVDGVRSIGGSGDANLRDGLALHIFTINAPMHQRALVNADGDCLLVAQLGNLDIQTELGKLFLQPGEIAVIPRGIRHRIDPAGGSSEARGYIIESWDRSGVPAWRTADFLTPVAFIDDTLQQDWHLFTKINGKYFVQEQDHSPFDVAAWHGTCVPFKYDLTKFVSISSVSVDHTDPSIYTVLTARSRDPTTPLVDFLWFGPHWDVALNTFRPPYFHRNAASEFLANIYTAGDGGGRSSGFKAGGGSYEAGHTAHGGSSGPYLTEMRRMKNEPRIVMPAYLTFMMESSRSLLFTEWGASMCTEEATSPEVWAAFPDRFSTDPQVQKLLQSVQETKRKRQAEDAPFYHDEE